MQPDQPAVQLPPSLANQPSLDSLVKAIQADWYEAVRILQMAPDLAKQNDPYGSSPLHFAAMHRANVEVSGKWRNDRSLFCLDALMHKPIYIIISLAQVVTLLLRIHPGAAESANKSQYLPLHYAAGNGAAPEVVALIWSAHKEAAQRANGVGLTALEVAVQQSRCDAHL
jgi:hypothetical protein